VKVALGVFVVTLMVPVVITVPCNGILVGELGALLVILTDPEYGPAPAGEKMTSNVPEVLGAMFPMLDDGLMMKNGFCVEMSEMMRLAVPVFEIVT